MPKISKQNVRCYDGKTHHPFEVVIFYDTKGKFFYVAIPSSLHDLEKLLTEEEREVFNIKYKTEKEPIVFSATENGALSKLKECAENLIKRTITKRNVIIVYFNQHTDGNWHRYAYDETYHKIGLNYGLTFAEETVSNQQKRYSVMRTAEGSTPWKQDISWNPNERLVIIEDTPENRAKLQQIHEAISLLIEKLSTLLKTPESVMNFIESGLKLLN